MVFCSFFKLPNFKVIAVRLRKNRQNRDNSAITSHDSGDSVPAIPVVLPSPALPSDSSPTYDVSARSEERIQVFTPGGSDKVQLASIMNGLFTILQTIDRHAQNQAAIASLRRRLQRLWGYLCNAPSAHGGSEQSRRDELISLLQDISDQLTKLDNGGLGYQAVTQTLAGFSTELDHYLAEYTRATQMHTQNDALQIKTQVLQFQGSAGMDLPRAVTRHCLTLVDAIGREHKIPMEFCISLPKFNETLQALFANNSFEAHTQRKYMEQGQYDLCIDQGTKVIELTDKTDGWSRIEAGTKVVMRVIIHQEVHPYSTISCVACGNMDVSVRSAGMRESGHWTISCQGCDRRYQISNPSLAPKNVSDTRRATDHAMMDLIRNVHVRENFLERRLFRFVRDLILRGRYTMLTEPLPCPTLRNCWNPNCSNSGDCPNPSDEKNSSNCPHSNEKKNDSINCCCPCDCEKNCSDFENENKNLNENDWNEKNENNLKNDCENENHDCDENDEKNPDFPDFPWNENQNWKDSDCCCDDEKNCDKNCPCHCDDCDENEKIPWIDGDFNCEHCCCDNLSEKEKNWNENDPNCWKNYDCENENKKNDLNCENCCCENCENVKNPVSLQAGQVSWA